MNRKGFTLLEALLVLVVLALILVLAGPSWRSFNHRQLECWARHLASDLRWSQLRAICEDCNQYIEFDIDDNSYFVYELVDDEKKIIRRRQVEPPVELKGINISIPLFHFTPSGAPSRGSTITLLDPSRQAKIIIAVATGRVRIEYQKGGLD